MAHDAPRRWTEDAEEGDQEGDGGGCGRSGSLDEAEKEDEGECGAKKGQGGGAQPALGGGDAVG